MSSHSARSIIAAAVLLAISPQSIAAGIIVRSLGVLPEFTASYAQDVSDDGRVVVGFSHRNNPNRSQAFRWTAETGMVALSGTFDSNSSGATAISGKGEVIVGAITPPGQNSHGFRWTSADGLALVSHPQFRPSSVTAITPDGQFLVGGALDTQASGGSTSNVSFVYSASGLVSLGDLSGGIVFSGANGISADGSVVVGHATNSQMTQAYRWTEADGMVGLGDLPGGASRSIATAVSADGATIIGQGNVDGPTGSSQAFRWTSEEGMVGLGFLAGGFRYSTAHDVSGDGSIIVGESNASGSAFNQAFIWTEAMGMVKLYDYLAGLGAENLEGWEFRIARGISPDGRTIVGHGRNPQGQLVAFVVTVPEPSTLLLSAVAGMLAIVMAVRNSPGRRRSSFPPAP